MWHQRLLARQGDSREDLPHFVLECPAYDHIRERYAVLFGGHVGVSVAQRLEAVFDHDDQVMLAQCLWQMDVYRNDLLGLRYHTDVRVYSQPAGFIPSDPSLQCAADAGLGHVTRLGWQQQWRRAWFVLVAVVAMLVLSWFW